MPLTPEIPEGAVTVTTYKEYEKYLRGFARGAFPFLWIVGRPGICKSRSIERALGGQPVYHLRAGQITPIVFHMRCWGSLHLPIVLDDAENLADVPVGAKQISALGEHEGEKEMQYATAGTYLQKHGVPATFTTRSRLCVIANRWTPHGALQSRAMLVHFDPRPREIHLQVGTFFKNQKVYDWIGSVLHLIAGLDVRMYNKACQMEAAGLDWKEWIRETYCHDATTHIVQEIEADATFTTRKAREERFKNLTGQSRATYHRIVQRLKGRGQLTPLTPLDLPAIDLSQNPDPVPVADLPEPRAERPEATTELPEPVRSSTDGGGSGSADDTGDPNGEGSRRGGRGESEVV